jgi:hypothetical protein
MPDIERAVTAIWLSTPTSSTLHTLTQISDSGQETERSKWEMSKTPIRTDTLTLHNRLLIPEWHRF